MLVRVKKSVDIRQLRMALTKWPPNNENVGLNLRVAEAASGGSR
jgi:hypothetical protein